MKKIILYNFILISIIYMISNKIYATTSFNVDVKSMKIYDKLDVNTILTTDSDNLIYKSSNKSIAEISEDGIISTYGLGDFTITVEDENSSDTCKFSSGFFQGIDVSSFNGNVNWEKVKKYGIDFAMIRASWGWYSNEDEENNEEYNFQYDKQLLNNLRGASENSIPFGITHYAYAQNVEDAELEAEYVLNAINEYGKDYKDNLSLFIAYDIEYSKYEELSKKDLTDIVVAFCSKIYDAGYTPIVYSNLNFFRRLDLEILNALAYNFWYANYNKDIDFSDKITIADTKLSPLMFQYTDEGSIDGANNDQGYVDLDIMYMKDRVKIEVLDNGQVIDIIGADKGNHFDTYPIILKKGYELVRLEDKLEKIVDNNYTFENDTQINAIFNRIKVTGLSLKEKEININSFGEYTVDVLPLPENAILYDGEVIFESDNEEIAKVDNTGKITIINNGTCNINCYLEENRNISVECKVNINVEFIKGDVNKDGKINSTDAAYVLDRFKNNDSTELDIELGNLKVDEKLNSSDAAEILNVFKNNI